MTYNVFGGTLLLNKIPHRNRPQMKL